VFWEDTDDSGDCAACVHPEYESRMALQNIAVLPHYQTMSQPKRSHCHENVKSYLDSAYLEVSFWQ